MLRDEFDLTEPEVASVLALAHRRALDAMPSGQDSLRALQFHALEDLARRAAPSLDLRSEIAPRRLLAQVSGVTRTEPEDLQQEFLGVVRKITAIQDARPVHLLPAPGPRVSRGGSRPKWSGMTTTGARWPSSTGRTAAERHRSLIRGNVPGKLRGWLVSRSTPPETVRSDGSMT